jgi:hypothetical protein
MHPDGVMATRVAVGAAYRNALLVSLRFRRSFLSTSPFVSAGSPRLYFFTPRLGPLAARRLVCLACG